MFSWIFICPERKKNVVFLPKLKIQLDLFYCGLCDLPLVFVEIEFVDNSNSVISFGILGGSRTVNNSRYDIFFLRLTFKGKQKKKDGQKEKYHCLQNITIYVPFNINNLNRQSAFFVTAMCRVFDNTSCETSRLIFFKSHNILYTHLINIFILDSSLHCCENVKLITFARESIFSF